MRNCVSYTRFFISFEFVLCLNELHSNALGLSDIGIIVKPQDYDKVEADDFILQEEKEKIFF